MHVRRRISWRDRDVASQPAEGSGQDGNLGEAVGTHMLPAYASGQDGSVGEAVGTSMLPAGLEQPRARGGWATGVGSGFPPVVRKSGRPLLLRSEALMIRKSLILF